VGAGGIRAPSVRSGVCGRVRRWRRPAVCPMAAAVAGVLSCPRAATWVPAGAPCPSAPAAPRLPAARCRRRWREAPEWPRGPRPLGEDLSALHFPGVAKRRLTCRTRSLRPALLSAGNKSLDFPCPHVAHRTGRRCTRVGLGFSGRGDAWPLLTAVLLASDSRRTENGGRTHLAAEEGQP
jgi:hypothetical protein